MADRTGSEDRGDYAPGGELETSEVEHCRAAEAPLQTLSLTDMAGRFDCCVAGCRRIVPAFQEALPYGFNQPDGEAPFLARSKPYDLNVQTVASAAAVNPSGGLDF